MVVCHEISRGSYPGQFFQTYLNTKSLFYEMSRDQCSKMLPHFCSTNVGPQYVLELIVLGLGESAADKTSPCHST